MNRGCPCLEGKSTRAGAAGRVSQLRQRLAFIGIILLRLEPRLKHLLLMKEAFRP